MRAHDRLRQVAPPEFWQVLESPVFDGIREDYQCAIYAAYMSGKQQGMEDLMAIVNKRVVS